MQPDEEFQREQLQREQNEWRDGETVEHYSAELVDEQPEQIPQARKGLLEQILSPRALQ